MPNNYSLVVDSSFTPLSFQDWLAPASIATAEHNEIQKNLAELQENANVWENMIDPDNDPGANAMYQNYAEALRKRADNLQRYGLNYNSRKSMYDIKARYNSEIKPIETAFNRRKELAKSQAEAISKDPTRMFQRDASKMSLDTFIADPEANYGWETSGALITSQVSQAAKALAKQLRSEDGKGILKKLGIPYMWDYIHQHGYTDKEVLQAILRDKDASPVLTNLVEQVMQASGVYGTGDTGLINKTREYANLGLYDAIGETTNQVLTDQAGLAAYKHSLIAPKKEPVTGPPININNLTFGNAGKNTAEVQSKQIDKIAQDFNLTQMGVVDLKDKRITNEEPISPNQSVGGLSRRGGPRENRNIYNKNGGTTFNLFGQNRSNYGWLLSREEFVNQAAEGSKQAAGRYYDNLLKNLESVTGPSQNDRGWSYTEVSQKLEQAKTNANKYGNAVGYKAIEVPIDMGKFGMRGVVSPIKLDNGELSGRIIEKYDPYEDELKFSAKIPRAKDYIEDGKLISADDARLHVHVNRKGEMQLIVKLAKENGESDQILVDPEHYGSYLAEIAQMAGGVAYLSNLKEYLIANIGERAYNASKEGKDLDKVLKETNAAMVEGTANRMGLVYKVNPYNTNQTSSTFTETDYPEDDDWDYLSE